MHLEVRIVPPEMYPNLKINPTNHWTEMPAEERLKHFIQTMGRVWAETIRDQLKKRKEQGDKPGNDLPPAG